jgi:hypothetical protein
MRFIPFLNAGQDWDAILTREGHTHTPFSRASSRPSARTRVLRTEYGYTIFWIRSSTSFIISSLQCDFNQFVSYKYCAVKLITALVYKQ